MELSLKDRILIKGLMIYVSLDIELMPVIDSLPDIVSYIDFTVLMTWALLEYLRLRKLYRIHGKENIKKVLFRYYDSDYKYDVIFCLLGLGICWYYNDGQWWFLLLILAGSTIARFIEPLKGMLRR